METLKFINFLIATIFFICYFYQICYIPIPFFIKEKPHKRAGKHRYAVLISARNEEKVIAQLIESINGQTYPKELITTFVMADNCTDNTAELARRVGAVVYERFDEGIRQGLIP
jgi:cellulose synthase/poly-beta-1,6-N-acetylglucosamine synthase-like glycosyltransferase